MSIYNTVSNRAVTPQGEPILGRESEMVQNAAGGYVFGVDDWVRLERFLILGTEGGTYYANERSLTRENLSLVEKLIKVDGPRVVDTVVDISQGGRAPRNTPVVWALAACSVLGDEKTKSAANKALPLVCRTGAHLFQWASGLKALNGHGPSGAGQRRAIARWYLERDLDQLVYQLIKYRQRSGWTHRDMLRLSKPGADQLRLQRPTDKQSVALGWAAGKKDAFFDSAFQGDGECDELAQLRAFEMLQKEGANVGLAADLIRAHRMPWEAVPSALLNSVEVWRALLNEMPLTAMIRNLGKMSSIGLLAQLSDDESRVVESLQNADAIKKARLHPVTILNALKVYGSGHGLKGSLSWNPNPAVTNALDRAFYDSFHHIQPTGKRIYVAIDASGSMTWDHSRCAGLEALRAVDGAAAFAMAVARTEPRHFIGGFHHEFVNTGITALTSMQDAVLKLGTGGATDASVPFKHAAQNGIKVDAFVIFTDNETWAGRTHPTQALKWYRQATGINARLVVASVTATESTICDPSDPLQMDVVGFDANAPMVINDFLKGE